MAEETVKIEKTADNINHYELVYLVSNKYSEDELEPIARDVLKLLKDNGCTIVKEDRWGKRKLAYPIKHLLHAYYIVVEFDASPEVIKPIDQNLRLSEEVVRYLITTTRIKSEAEIINEQQAAAERAQQQAEHLAERSKQNDRYPEPARKIAEKKEVDIQELDKKLDELLDNTENLI